MSSSGFNPNSTNSNSGDNSKILLNDPTETNIQIYLISANGSKYLNISGVNNKKALIPPAAILERIAAKLSQTAAFSRQPKSDSTLFSTANYAVFGHSSNIKTPSANILESKEVNHIPEQHRNKDAFIYRIVEKSASFPGNIPKDGYSIIDNDTKEEIVVKGIIENDMSLLKAIKDLNINYPYLNFNKEVLKTNFDHRDLLSYQLINHNEATLPPNSPLLSQDFKELKVREASITPSALTPPRKRNLNNFNPSNTTTKTSISADKPPLFPSEVQMTGTEANKPKDDKLYTNFSIESGLFFNVPEEKKAASIETSIFFETSANDDEDDTFKTIVPIRSNSSEDLLSQEKEEEEKEEEEKEEKANTPSKPKVKKRSQSLIISRSSSPTEETENKRPKSTNSRM